MNTKSLSERLEDCLWDASKPIPEVDSEYPHPLAKINYENLTIVLAEIGKYPYEIDLETCNSASKLADWIFQVHGKPWSTPEMMMSFLNDIECACWTVFGHSIQHVFCPCGKNHKVNWRLKTFS